MRPGREKRERGVAAAWTRKARKGGGGGLDEKSEKGGWRRPGREKRVACFGEDSRRSLTTISCAHSSSVAC